MWHKNGEIGRTWIGRLPFRQDMLESIQRFAETENIECARVEVIGAVEKAVISYYDQDRRVYEDRLFDEHLEIVSCIGNLSLRDGKPAAHLHISLGSREGKLLGGHLQKGTVIFAGEFIIQEIRGPALFREYDGETGLPLWKKTAPR